MSENDENVEETTVVGEVRLEHGLVRKEVARNAASLECLHESNVGNVDTCPGNETGNTGNIHQPVESSGCTCALVHESKETKSGGETNGIVWNTFLAGTLEEGRGKTAVGKTDDDAGARVNVGVGSTENDAEQDCIDQTWKSLDTSKFGCDDEWRRRGVGVARKELVVIVWNEKTNEEDGEDEEEQDTVEGLPDGSWDSLARVVGLTGGNTDKLSSLVRETGLNQNGPETNKLGNPATSNKVRSKCTRVTPSIEPKITVLSSASVNANGEDHEADNGNDLDHSKVKLDLSVERDRQEVDRCNDEPEGTDKDTDVKIRPPVLDDKATCC